jgi:hypothetical protein
VKRLAIVLIAILIGAAAPARAWCEASCLAPVQDSTTSTKAHCPTNNSASTGTSMAATTIDECPVVESARPIQARLDAPMLAIVSFAFVAPSAPQHPRTRAPQHLPTSVGKRLTALRI